MSNHPKVVSIFYFQPQQQAILREAAGGEIVFVRDAKELIPALKDAEVACLGELPESWQEVAPQLRWVQCPGAGVDGLRKSSAFRPNSGIVFTNASGVHMASISEYVLCSMMMFNRSWPTMMKLQEQHIWPSYWRGDTQKYELRERELSGHTLGIVGLGSIGRRIAQVGRAFGMKIIATSFSTREEAHDPDVDQLFPLSQLHTLLSQSDYVVLSMPLTDKSTKMIGEPELRAMKKDAYLVNIARGGVIDEAVLIRALQEGWIAGAGLDVTEVEPLPEQSPLYSLPNVILTPHISGGSERYAERFAELFADNLRRYRTGQPLRNLVDTGLGY